MDASSLVDEVTDKVNQNSWFSLTWFSDGALMNKSKLFI